MPLDLSILLMLLLRRLSHTRKKMTLNGWLIGLFLPIWAPSSSFQTYSSPGSHSTGWLRYFITFFKFQLICNHFILLYLYINNSSASSCCGAFCISPGMAQPSSTKELFVRPLWSTNQEWTLSSMKLQIRPVDLPQKPPMLVRIHTSILGWCC